MKYRPSDRTHCESSSSVIDYSPWAEKFETEQMNPVEMQRQGWQAILNNFKNYTESLD